MGTLNNAGAGNPTDLVRIDKAGTIDKLYVRVTATTLTANASMTLYKNGSATLLSAVINSGSFGLFTDLVNSVTVAAGDTISIQYDQPSGTGTRPTIANVCATFTPSSGTTQILSAGNDGGITHGITASRFTNILGPLATVNATETTVQTVSAVAGSLHGFSVRITANTWSGTVNCWLRKNGADGNQVAVIGAGATGLITDITGTPDTIAALDLLSMRLNASGAGSLTMIATSVNLDATTDTESTLSCYGTSAISVGTKFVNMGGSRSVATSENSTQDVIGLACTIDLIGFNVLSNASTSITTINLKNNGSIVNGVISIGASASGVCVDITGGSDVIAAGDLLAYQVSGHNGTVTSRHNWARIKTTAAGGTVYNVGVTEAGSAADSASSVATLPAAVNDNAAAADAPASTAVRPAAVAEVASAAETPASVAVLPAALVDAPSAADSPSSTAVLPSAVVEAGNAQDTDTANPGGLSTITEAANAQDTVASTLVGSAAIAEAITATDTRSAAAVLPAALAESAALVDVLSARVTFLAALVELGIAADLPAAKAIMASGVVEAAAAVDAPSTNAARVTASKCNILTSAPRVRVLGSAPRIRVLGGDCC